MTHPIPDAALDADIATLAKKGAGTCDEAPRTALGHDGRKVCSGGSFPCPECDGTGKVLS